MMKPAPIPRWPSGSDEAAVSASVTEMDTTAFIAPRATRPISGECFGPRLGFASVQSAAFEGAASPAVPANHPIRATPATIARIPPPRGKKIREWGKGAEGTFVGGPHRPESTLGGRLP